MDAVSDRRRERFAALAILAFAVLIAIWIGHRPRLDRLPTPPEPATPDLSALMAPVEVVELPPAPTAPAPAPPPAPQQAAPAPTPPAPVSQVQAPPQPQRVEAPPPEPMAAPAKPVEIARVSPPAVTPLRPEPTQRPVDPPPVRPLKPEAAPRKPALPPPMPLTPESKEALKTETALPPPLKPMQPDEAELAAFRTARDEAKAIEPLKPEPLPKPTPPPKEDDLAEFRAAREQAKQIEPLKPEPLPKSTALPSQPVPDIKPLAPEPPKAQVAKAEPPPKPRVQAPTAPPPPPPVARPAPQPVIASGNVGEGRALLRILEQGSGPGIQIGWPGDADARDRLYRVLVQCFGMRVGVLDAENRLYMAEGQAGEPSEFNTDRYSGFVRRPEGAMAADEQREVTRLRGYHHVAATASIRVFPRRVDAFLISGLRQAVGENYLGLKSIRAIYRVTGQRVTVDTIAADGKSVPGVIDLSAVSTSCSE